MAKKSTKTILAALKATGVEIEDQSKVEGALDDIELSADEFVGSDQILLSKDEHRELKDDLTKLRKRAKDAEHDRDEAREANEAGDSVNATKAKKLQTRNDELEPLVESLLQLHKDTWEGAMEAIPDNLKKQFRFADEGKELSNDDLIHNVNKVTEYRELELLPPPGATEDEDPEKKSDEKPAPGAPRVKGKETKKPLTAEQMAGMTPAQMQESVYEKTPQK